MEIEKLCEEFHKKVGKDKTVRISILEGDTEDTSKWFTGKMRPEVWKEILDKRITEKPKPFAKYSRGSGVEYSYVSFKEVKEV